VNGVNFIPGQRRLIGARRFRVRAWTVAVSAYAVLATIAFVGFATVSTGDDVSVAHRLQLVPAEIEGSRRTVVTLSQEVAEARARLEAARTVIDQPDWSVLLGVLARALGDDVVLTSCRLGAAQTTPAGAGMTRGSHNNASQSAPAVPVGQPPGRYLLSISGVGRSQSAVSQFVLRLERIGLFDYVSVLRTTREAYGDNEAIGFAVEASIGNGAGNSPNGPLNGPGGTAR